ncbi:MAG: NAD-dependent protein deacylase, partial [Clostridia bacterium]|nr:NAD-dependent protein deacylase [Clostridia bacterium]
MDEAVKTLQTMLEKSRVVAFLGGAGVSTESGIPDFRSAGSAAEAVRRFGYPPEVLLSHDFFMQETETFYAYYKSILLMEAKPNPAHYALARLEERGKINAVITQNIDNLHQKAGSKRVYPLHGNVEW